MSLEHPWAAMTRAAVVAAGIPLVGGLLQDRLHHLWRRPSRAAYAPGWAAP